LRELSNLAVVSEVAVMAKTSFQPLISSIDDKQWSMSLETMADRKEQ